MFYVLRKYLNKNIIKEFIRKLQSPVEYPILFIQKKDGILRLYIDYRELNVIIVNVKIAAYSGTE